MPRKSLFALAGIVAFSVPFLQGCDVEREIEKIVGVYSQVHVSLMYSPSRDPILAELTDSVGRQIRQVMPRRDMPLKFRVLDSGEVNAFALSNGRIYVLRGLMEMMETEDELASVLAHEAGHVAARHTLKDVRRNLLLTILADLGNLEKMSRLVQTTATVVWTLAELSFSRQQEYQADRYGLRLALVGRYDPRGSVDLFEKFAKREGRPSRLMVYLSTHPPAVDRVARARSATEDIHTIIPNLDSVSAHTLIGDGYRDRSLYRQALYHYQKALEQAPDHHPALLGSARSYEAWGDHRQAKAMYRKILERNPDDPEAKEGLERLEKESPATESPGEEEVPLTPFYRSQLEQELKQWQVLEQELTRQRDRLYSATKSLVLPLHALLCDLLRPVLRTDRASLQIGNRLTDGQLLGIEILLAVHSLVENSEVAYEDAIGACRLWIASLSDILERGKGERRDFKDIRWTSERDRERLLRALGNGSDEAEELNRVGRKVTSAVGLILRDGANAGSASLSAFGFRQTSLINRVATEALTETRLLQEGAKEKKEKVEKALISAYQSRLRALEQKTPPSVAREILAYHLRTDVPTVAEVQKKVPMGASAIIIAYAKAEKVSPVSLAERLDFTRDWIQALSAKAPTAGTKVVLKWLTTAWEREWEEEAKKEASEEKEGKGTGQKREAS